LPIGPDTSHIIAEVISSAIDLELKKKLKRFPPGFRYVDDYFLFFATQAEADGALAALVRLLQGYELQINFEKTKICSVQEISEDYWTHQLRSFEISRSGKKQLSDINHYFELSRDLAKRNSDESVMTYALKRIASTIIRKENWSIFESHICHVAMAYPNTLQIFTRLMGTYAKYRYPINRNRLSRVVNAIIEDHAPLGHHSEVVWSLWICKQLNLDLTDQNIDRVSDIYSSPCALLLMDLYSEGKLSKAPRGSLWKSQENSSALYDDLWLLSYEAGIRNWGGLSDAHIVKDKYFTELRKESVHFYDKDAVIKPLFHPRELPLENIKIDELFDSENVDEMIEYDDDNDGGYEGVVVPDDDDEEDSYL
jgi:hypothetical protein